MSEQKTFLLEQERSTLSVVEMDDRELTRECKILLGFKKYMTGCASHWVGPDGMPNDGWYPTIRREHLYEIILAVPKEKQVLFSSLVCKKINANLYKEMGNGCLPMDYCDAWDILTVEPRIIMESFVETIDSEIIQCKKLPESHI